MAVISERSLKEQAVKNALPNPYPLSPDDILTPAAREYLNRMDILVTQQQKTEDTTHLNANTLVKKTHPRIVLRGFNDSLQSEIILAQVEFEEHGLSRLVRDLDEIMRFLQKLIRVEVKDEPLEDMKLQNLSLHEIHEHSHHPSQYYGVKHFLPDRSQGKVCARLNRLRTMVRQVEIAALNAFPNGERKDLICAYNRLSSLFFVMMVKTQANGYKE